MKKSSSHDKKIISQFSKQAIPFTKVPGHMDSVKLLVDMSGVSESESVLDAACGPGIVACEFAKKSRHVTGIDITPEMIRLAEKAQREKGLSNMTWDNGSVLPLPYPDSSFDVVITRYSFHHFINPSEALAEMVRVCRFGGRVLAADVAVPEECSEAYDKMEIMRDSSHVHALTENEFFKLFSGSGLKNCRQSAYGVEIELENQLKASFPKAEDVQKIRDMVPEDIGENRIGINAYRKENSVIYTVPIAVYVGTK